MMEVVCFIWGIFEVILPILLTPLSGGYGIIKIAYSIAGIIVCVRTIKRKQRPEMLPLTIAGIVLCITGLFAKIFCVVCLIPGMSLWTPYYLYYPK